jgi:hypothetical protein
MLCLYAYGIYTPPTLLIWAILLPGFAAASALVSTRDKRQRQANAMLAHAMRTKVVNDFIGNHALWFNDTHIYSQHPGESRGLSWAHIAKIKIDPAFVIVIQTDSHGTHIPIRAFASQADAERFVALAQQTLHASGYGDANWIAKCLASHDAPCTKCKYNLRGTTTAACPECGHPLNRETLPWAFLVDAPLPTTK